MNLNNLISGLASSGVASGLAGGLAGGALSGALMSKRGRKYASTALKVGGMAAIGGLAWNAYQNYRKCKAEAAPGVAGEGAQKAMPAGSRRDPQPTRAAFLIDKADSSQDSRGLLIIRAMIAAAAADGHMDSREKTRIFAKVEALELSAPEKALLFDELAQPAGMSQVVAAVADMETAVEVYTASLLAVDETRLEGRIYLEGLASCLGLPAPLVQEIRTQGHAHNEAA